MRLYFHHVGQQGAERDFPKTVWSKVPLSTVERHLSASVTNRDEIIQTLTELFPSGGFNCWGVPAGAKSVIKNLRPGDAVLLVETTAGAGSVPALCIVKAFWSIAMPQLSEALWGEAKFPYVFFFDTIKIDLTWSEFSGDMDYAPNFRPSGNFYSVRDDRTEEFDGPSGYAGYLSVRRRVNDEGEYWTTPDLLEDLERQRQTYAELSETEREAIIKSRIGQGVFRARLFEYWHRCSVTGLMVPELLRASHIKPWRNSTNPERLDVFNGLLLVPNLDTSFDVGLLTFTDTGRILISSQLSREARSTLGIGDSLRLAKVDPRHRDYLRYHRENIFRE